MNLRYGTALKAPDNLGSFAAGDEEDLENEDLEYVAYDVLESLGLTDPRDSFDVNADMETSGSAWEEDKVEELYPKLAAKFG